MVLDIEVGILVKGIKIEIEHPYILHYSDINNFQDIHDYNRKVISSNFEESIGDVVIKNHLKMVMKVPFIFEGMVIEVLEVFVVIQKICYQKDEENVVLG